jgi:hypothetical protein
MNILKVNNKNYNNFIICSSMKLLNWLVILLLGLVLVLFIYNKRKEPVKEGFTLPGSGNIIRFKNPENINIDNITDLDDLYFAEKVNISDLSNGDIIATDPTKDSSWRYTERCDFIGNDYFGYNITTRQILSQFRAFPSDLSLNSVWDGTTLNINLVKQAAIRMGGDLIYYNDKSGERFFYIKKQRHIYNKYTHPDDNYKKCYILVKRQIVYKPSANSTPELYSIFPGFNYRTEGVITTVDSTRMTGYSYLNVIDQLKISPVTTHFLIQYYDSDKRIFNVTRYKPNSNAKIHLYDGLGGAYIAGELAGIIESTYNSSLYENFTEHDMFRMMYIMKLAGQYSNIAGNRFGELQRLYKEYKTAEYNQFISPLQHTIFTSKHRDFMTESETVINTMVANHNLLVIPQEDKNQLKIYLEHKQKFINNMQDLAHEGHVLESNVRFWSRLKDKWASDQLYQQATNGNQHEQRAYDTSGIFFKIFTRQADCPASGPCPPSGQKLVAENAQILSTNQVAVNQNASYNCPRCPEGQTCPPCICPPDLSGELALANTKMSYLGRYLSRFAGYGTNADNCLDVSVSGGTNKFTVSGCDPTAHGQYFKLDPVIPDGDFNADNTGFYRLKHGSQLTTCVKVTPSGNNLETTTSCTGDDTKWEAIQGTDNMLLYQTVNGQAKCISVGEKQSVSGEEFATVSNCAPGSDNSPSVKLTHKNEGDDIGWIQKLKRQFLTLLEQGSQGGGQTDCTSEISTIAGLSTQITSLNTQITDLNSRPCLDDSSCTEKDTIIAQYSTTIGNHISTITGLQNSSGGGGDEVEDEVVDEVVVPQESLPIVAKLISSNTTVYSISTINTRIPITNINANRVEINSGYRIDISTGGTNALSCNTPRFYLTNSNIITSRNNSGIPQKICSVIVRQTTPPSGLSTTKSSFTNYNRHTEPFTNYIDSFAQMKWVKKDRQKFEDELLYPVFGGSPTLNMAPY